LSRFRESWPLRLAALAALAAALALAGCGRKGPLDAPPSAAISPPPQSEPSLGEIDDPNTPGFRRAPRPTAAAPAPTVPPEKRTFILDPLIK
jgi:predicted small lipoprotein YifL